MNKEKSILFIVPDMQQGGAERIVLNLLQKLENSPLKTYLVLMRKEGYYLELLPESVEVIDLQSKRIRNSIFKIVKILRRIKPDIVFTGYGEVNALLAPFLFLYRPNRFIARETNVISQHVQHPLIRFLYQFYRNYPHIIAQSHDMRQDLINHWKVPSAQIELIHNPVNIAFIQKESSAFYPQEFFTSSKKVVAMGNLSDRKGFDLLLQVFEILKEKDIELFIIGDGPQKEEYIQLKEKLLLDKVHFLGRKNNPYPYLKNADLFVLSSRYEGFPNALLEAGACGTYSLANDCLGGIHEIIEEGVNGSIASIENTQEFAHSLQEILKQSHEPKIIQNSIEVRFDQDLIFQQYYSLFEKVLSNEP